MRRARASISRSTTSSGKRGELRVKTQKTPLFQGIGEAALAEMFTCGGARCKTYAKGEVLLRAG